MAKSYCNPYLKILYNTWFLSFSCFTYISFVESYRTTHVFTTQFLSKHRVTNAMMNSGFFDMYLKQVDAKDITWHSREFGENNELVFPQQISYKSKPSISQSFINREFIPVVKIHHDWERKDDTFCGKITTKYLCCNLFIRPQPGKEGYYDLCVTGEITNKKYNFIPNSCLDEIIHEFGCCFQNFTL